MAYNLASDTPTSDMDPNQEIRLHAMLASGGQLSWTVLPDPVAAPGEVVIQVAAAGMNRADLLQIAGHYPPPPGASPVIGLECSGTVISVGEGVSWPQPGDQVCALLSGGGYAERVAVPATQCLAVPANHSLVEAAALPEVFATAYLNLYIEGGLQPGELAVLHAGASGVGTAGLQLCRALGNPAFVTVGSQGKLDACLTLGATAGALRHEGPWLSALQRWAPEGVDVILDPVGGSYLAENLKALRTGGRLVLIGLMGGAHADLDLATVLRRRLRVVGSVLRSRSTAEKATLIRALTDQVWPLLHAGIARAVVESVIPMKDAKSGVDLLASNQTVGKIVLNLQSCPNGA